MLEEQGAEVYCFNCSGNREILFSVLNLVKFLKENKIDLIHAHLPMAGIVARFAGKLAGVPVIYTEHNLMERYHPLTRALSKLNFSWQKAVVAVSADVADSIHKNTDTKVPVHIVLNGINTRNFRRDELTGKLWKQKLGIPEDAVVIGNVAVFREQKQLPLWLDIATELKRIYPNVWFLLVGSGPLLPEVKSIIDRNKLGDRIVLPGLQEDIRPYLFAMDIFMLTSKFEGLPLALLEAMASGLAVVATSVGGVPEVIENGVSGLLTENKKEHILSQVKLLIEDQDLRLSLAHNAKQRVELHFSIERMVGELEKLYLEILHKP
jgi:glycosyltransferase involved in cell wall biosynthesis